MRLHLLLLALIALPAHAAAPVKLALPGFQGVGMDRKFMEFFTEELAEHLTGQGMSVVTAREITNLLGLERQRELVGCTEAASNCMAEIGNALGADGIVLGSIARVGGAIQVNVKIIDTNTADRAGTFTKRIDKQELILDALEEAAVALAKSANAYFAAKKPVVAAAPTVTVIGGKVEPRTVTRSAALIPAAAAVVFAGGASYFVLQAQRYNEELLAPIDRGAISSAEANDLVARGEGAQLYARVGFGLAAACAVGAVSMWLFGASSSGARASMIAGPDGAGLSVAVDFR